MTKKSIRITSVLTIVLLLAVSMAVPAFAVTEAEVEAAVSTSSKETVAGNVLIWFLCAIAFLKVSQKIDSFMATLGINVGRTGGSMLAEAMIATRGVATVAGIFGGGGHRSGVGSSGSGSGASGSSSGLGFLKGGLAGVVSRKVTNDAVKTATTTTAAVNTATSKVTSSAVHTAASADQRISTGQHTNTAQHTNTNQHTGTDQHVGTMEHSAVLSEQHSSEQASQLNAQTITGQVESHVEQSVSEQAVSPGVSAIPGTPGTPGQVGTHNNQSTVSQTQTDRQSASHTAQSSASATHKEKQTTSFKGIGLGGAIFAKSLQSGGSFANDVIGRVATGDFRSTGSITGELASQSLMSYMGYTAQGEAARDVPSFADVEIGGGRITGIETAPGSSEGLAFGMYHTEQYAAPQGEYSKVQTADGMTWYKQYAQDAVERKPYKAPDDTVAYHESIVKKLPNPPKRKDRM